nr:CpsD/CapB family tyrosine-protein kinase [uncultured Desulfobulbus sp.]
MGKVFDALKRADEAEDSAEKVYKPVAETSSAQIDHPEPAQRVQPETRTSRPSEPRRELGKWDNRLVLSTMTTGPIPESIRSLRTRILFPGEGPVPRSILITSTAPGEGKSFISANLAISLAQGVDNYCLLVDCDLRRPSQHELFGLSNKAGLSDYLQHKKRIQELLAPSGVDKLSILPAGPPPINPAELASSGAMIGLVDEISQRYDDRIVLLDSPPLHSASETAVLAQHVDGVVLVVRHGSSRREYVKALVDTIGREKILGVVFNAYKATLLDYKVFGYYEYQQDYYANRR